MNIANVLLVEDEENILKTIKLNLELEGYNVTTAITGKEALVKFKTSKFQLVILDVMLPELNGYDVCKEIRVVNSSIPVLFLTAKATSQDKIQGLKIGADDYLTKPFNLEELLLRVQILIKRNNPITDNKIKKYIFEDNEIDFIKYEIKGVKNSIIKISKRELELLQLLISKKGEVISREEILDTVWGTDVYPSSRTVDNYILTFRKNFEIDQRNPKHFHSIRGVGYKFTD